MTKGDWIRVVETLFTEVQFDKNLNAVKGVLDDRVYGDFKEDRREGFPFPVIPNSRVFTMDKHRTGDRIIIILSNNLMDGGSLYEFWGDYLVIQPELEVCIISRTSSMSHIPWDDVSVITMADHP